jgi:hypothetical protein
MTNKGFVFVVDVLLMLVFTGLLISIVPTSNVYKNYEEIMITQQISDILLTTQQQEIKTPEIITNISKLFKNRKVLLKINNKTHEINPKLRFSRKISNSITYINSYNKEIYIEVIVFY